MVIALNPRLRPTRSANLRTLRAVGVAIGLMLPATSQFAANPPTGPGLFEDHGDIGTVGHPGAAEYDAARGSYLVAGGGGNMWFTNDTFHFVWKRMSGDCSLSANLRWIGARGNEHRKACLVIRQTLEPDSAYADAAVHGNGLTSLQYRETSGGLTREIQSNVSAPERVRIEKRGDYVSMSVAPSGGSLQPAGGSFRIRFQEPFYVGLGVCAHDNNALEQAVFSQVELTALPESAGRAKPRLESTLETIAIASKDRRVVYHATNRIEAPNWTRDGRSLLFNGQGHIYQLPLAGGAPQLIDTGFAIHCNNDHGLSPDGTLLAISDQTEERKSLIYLLSATGGAPRRITRPGPSYWHGWSPDGKTLVFCGERNENFDIYSIPVEGGEEQRLTTAPGLDDGPDFSPDGKLIYFNSERTGSMQVWRMKPDGSGQEPMTSDGYNNWFPHPSPDGKWIVFLSYPREVSGHPENKDVMLRLIPAAGGEIQILAKLFGGQGTMNVPSWSPDSRALAFVSYQLVYSP